MIWQVELIALLLNESGIVRGVSAQTALNQQTMQFPQSGYCDPRLAEFHAHAYNRIQHPCRDYRDCAGAVVYVNDTSTAALFAISIANFPPKERVPAIVNLKFLTDMGRMSGESPSAAATICSPVRTTVAKGQLLFIV
jgi:hypothetical protein